MANILLIEPNYNCKYPPLGLMKIAYYHKEIRNDFVWFSKGELPYEVTEEIKDKLNKSKYYIDKYKGKIDKHIDYINDVIKNRKWDRVYISTLFTYEMEKTVKAIKYAINLVSYKTNNIYVGGILATLMGERIERRTGVNVVRGLLSDSSMIGFKDGVNVDLLTPDYSILDNIEYEYPAGNAYFAYTTRGCGMNCEFCAVKVLEPDYKPFISIKKQIKEINYKYGPKKDLLLMDNNVLKSPRFEEIIKEIKYLGYKKGENETSYVNPKTNKPNIRYVDFNQGLDLFLFTEKKAELLSEVAINPARIAFDHIEDRKVYEKALKNAVKYGIRFLSNYILYNADDFEGKGRNYKADTPQDLYNRLKINVEFQHEYNQDKNRENHVKIFSFPMRYIPLEDTKRGYVGKHWNMKYLRAIQRILIPTQGKGVTSKSFFCAAFGETENEFMQIIKMPEAYIATRGEPNKIRNINEEERKIKIEEFNLWQSLRNKWRELYDSLNEYQKEVFEEIISINTFDSKSLIDIKDKKMRKLFVHYFSESGLILLLDELENYMEDEIKDEITKYIKVECTCILERLTKYLIDLNINNNLIKLYFKFFHFAAVKCLLEFWEKDNFQDDKVIDLLKFVDSSYFDTYYLKLIKWGNKFNLFSNNEIKELKEALYSNNQTKLSIILDNRHEDLYREIIKHAEYQITKDKSTDHEIASTLVNVKRELSTQITFSHIL